MKKLLLLLVAVIFSTGIFAQDGKMPKRDHLMMSEGKMWIMKNGKSTAMTKDITLSNGTIVTLSGKVTSTDGNSQMLGNGDYVDMDGIITKSDSKKDKSKMQ